MCDNKILITDICARGCGNLADSKYGKPLLCKKCLAKDLELDIKKDKANDIIEERKDLID